MKFLRLSITSAPKHTFLLFLTLTVLVWLSYQATKKCNPPKPKHVTIGAKCPTKIRARESLRVDSFHCQKKKTVNCCGPLVTDLSGCYQNPKICRSDSIRATRYCPLTVPNCCCKGTVYNKAQQCDSQAGVKSGARSLFQDTPTCDDLDLSVCDGAVDPDNLNLPAIQCFNSSFYNCSEDISDETESTNCVCTSADIIIDESTDQEVNNYRLCFFGQCFSNDLYFVPNVSEPVIKLRAANPHVQKDDEACEDELDGSYSGKQDGAKTCSGMHLYISFDCRWEKHACPQANNLTSQCRPDVFNGANCVIDDGRWFEPCTDVITERSDCTVPFTNDTFECTDPGATVCYGKDIIVCENDTWTLNPCSSGTQCRDGVCTELDCLLYENCSIPGFGQCGSENCSLDEECCNSTCFNPLTSECFNGTVCPNNYSYCDGACYLSDESYCINDTLCELELELCGVACFNTSENICINNILCPLGSRLCGKNCYDPTDTICNNGSLCNANLRICGSVCYDPHRYTCFGTKLCKAGLKICNIACYDTNKFVCIDDKLCPAGHKLCGDACYKPDQFSCCGSGENAHLCPHT
jgi:hypothetical protein